MVVCFHFASILEFTARGNGSSVSVAAIFSKRFPDLKELSSEVDYKFARDVGRSAGIDRHYLRPMCAVRRV